MSRSLAMASVLTLLAGCGGSSTPPDLLPTVTSVVPRGGPVAGGSDVVVAGSGFVRGASVRFGSAAATDVVWVSETVLHARTPAHEAGGVAVAVANPSGRTGSLPDGFTYALPPTAVVAGTLRAPVGTPVALDGGRSTDPSLLGVTWRWTLLSAPAGSASTLSGADTPVATLTPDVAGRYTASLVLTGLGGASAPVTAEVRTITTGSLVPDSGQRACFDGAASIPCPVRGAPWDGQDGQYTIRPASFETDAGTETDSVTGLVWQRVGDGSKHNFYEAAGILDPVYNPAPAVDVCGSLVLGGWSDWRLPSRRELFTLLRMEWVAGQAFADLEAFPDISGESSSNYWTASVLGADGLPWAVDFGSGRATYGYGSRASGLWVRCVRGPPWGASAFVDQGDGTVRDDGTGLVWEQAPANVAYAWEEALAHCEALPLAGGGWRLPSSKEMDTLLDGTRTMPAVDPAFFPGTVNDRYWTSTTTGWVPGHALAGDMAFGWVDGPFDKGTSSFARCVR